MAEWSTKALASKAFLVNHAEFEAIVSLRKDNFPPRGHLERQAEFHASTQDEA